VNSYQSIQGNSRRRQNDDFDYIEDYDVKRELKKEHTLLIILRVNHKEPSNKVGGLD